MYSYVKCSGMGLRWDVFDGTRRICIAHSEEDAKAIVSALQKAKVKEGK